MVIGIHANMERLIVALLSFIFVNELFAIQPETDEQQSQIPSVEAISSPGSRQAQAASFTHILDKIQLLRRSGQLQEAQEAAIQHLKIHPENVDVELVLGLIYFQQKKFVEAENHLISVLTRAPGYIAARAGLVRTKMAQNDFKEAKYLLDEGLKKHPDNAQLLLLKRQYDYLISTQNSAQENTSRPDKLQSSMNDKAIIAVADSYLEQNNEEDALHVIRQALKDEPDNHSLLLKEEAIYTKITLREVQFLRQQGNLQEAQEKSLRYLKRYPQGLDVELVLGLIYFQQKNYLAAENHLHAVLMRAPGYIAARAGLVRVKIAQNNFKTARALLDEGLKKSPKDSQLLLLKKQYDYLILTKKKARENKHAQVESVIDEKSTIGDALLAEKNDMNALLAIRRALKKDPDNISLLLKAGEIHTILRQYALAARAYQRVLILSPNNKSARGYLAEIKDISPYYTHGVNEVGIMSSNAYVSDLHSIWNYSTGHYARDTPYGLATAKVNYASRLHKSAAQYEIGFSPRFNRNIYLDLATAYSDQPALFPNLMVSAEGYVNIPQFFELSGGGKYAKIDRTYFVAYTGSFSIYPEKFWFSFRPYYFVPKNRSEASLLYTAKARRYFSTVDHYVGIGAGLGHSPDLADLLTVNFFVIKNSFVNVNYVFPILNHRIVVDLGAGYQRWQYPSDLVRKLYNGTIGFKYRF